MRALGWIAFALAACGASPKSTSPQEPGATDTTTKGAPFAPRKIDAIASVIPLQRVPATVTPHAVGLVFVTGRQPWGGTIDHERNVDANPRREVYALSVGRSSPYPMYWEATAGGEHFMKGWDVCLPGGSKARYDATAYNHRSPNAYGLKRRAHIVELEVNGGRGGCPNDYFVASAAKILDGTPEIPLDPEKAILDLRRRFDGLIAGYADQLQPAEQGADQSVGVLPTWLPEARELEVLFVYRKTSAKHPRGVAMAARYRVDRTGAFQSEQVFLPTAFTEGR